MSIWLIAVVAFLGYKYYKSKTAVSGEAPSGSSLSKWMNANTAVVALHGLTVICGVLYLSTLNSTFRFAGVSAAIVSSILVIFTNYGSPNVSREAIRAPMQEWLGRCMSGAEFPALFFTLMFLNDYATQISPFFALGDLLGMILIIRRSVWFLGSHGSKAWVNVPVWNSVFGNRIWPFLKAREVTIMEYVTLSEIFLGFWLILLLITPARQIMNTFVYWTFLRVRYISPRTRSVHSLAWDKVDLRTKPIRAAVPVLDKVIALVVKWFNQGA